MDGWMDEGWMELWIGWMNVINVQIDGSFVPVIFY